MRLSSIASRLGKTPVITPRHSHIGWRLAFAHWSLAVKVVMEMGVRVEYLEKALKDGGFTEGPFTTMKKVSVNTGFCTILFIWVLVFSLV